MKATLKDMEKYLSENKPGYFQFSETEIRFCAGNFDFIIIPRYDGIDERCFFEIEMRLI
jgi:hypothetical protein